MVLVKAQIDTKFHNFSLRAVKFPDISGFSSEVVTRKSDHITSKI